MSRARRFRCSALLGALLLLAAGAAAARQPGPEACGAPPLGAPDDEGKDPGGCLLPGEPTGAFAEGAALAQAEADSDTDVTHYLLDLEIIPEYDGATLTAVRVEGTSTIDFQPTVDGLTTFTVDLHGALAVSAVTGDVAAWSRVGDTVEIGLDRAYDAGEPVHVAVVYGGVPVDAAFGAFRWWLRNGELVVATLSEPYYARRWWPCKDALDDKATMEMQVTVPSGMLALSNGVDLGSQPLPGNRTRHLWHETHPMIPYLASLAVTGYERYDLEYAWDDGGAPATMTVPCYVYPDHWSYATGEPLAAYKAGCDELPGMLETFGSLFGEYPFVDEKYGVVETGGPGGLGASMEHQTLSSMFRLDNYSDIMAHELAHQWWGDDVTTQTWYDIWLNEGFASYGEALYREFRAGGSADLYWTRMNARRPSNPDAQVYRTGIATVSQIFSTNDVYNKGAWVLHMLRHVLGDAAFLAFLADYRADFAGDSATSDELTASLSASFGANLAWFTEQWVLGPGSPDYEWNWAAETIGGQTYLKLAVWQRQDADGYGVFTMPIDVNVTTASGTTAQRIWNDDWTEHYVLPIDGPPLAVAFDAEGGIANRNRVLWDSLVRVATSLALPPVLLAADVAAAPAAGDDTTIALTFSEDVGGFEPADVRLDGSASGVHAPDAWSYDSPARRATLSWAALPADDYVLTVLDAGVQANGEALDGDTDDDAWWDHLILPSGDGQPGGAATLAFSLAWPACSDGLDNDGDGLIDLADPNCNGPNDTTENPPPLAGGCGFGPELALVLLPLWWLRRVRRAA